MSRSNLRFAIITLVFSTATICSGSPSYGQSEDFKKRLEDADRQSRSDFSGEKGQQAMEKCNRRLRIRVPVRNAQDVAREYGVQRAMTWTQCVVDEMYP